MWSWFPFLCSFSWFVIFTVVGCTLAVKDYLALPRRTIRHLKAKYSDRWNPLLHLLKTVLLSKSNTVRTWIHVEVNSVMLFCLTLRSPVLKLKTDTNCECALLLSKLWWNDRNSDLNQTVYPQVLSITAFLWGRLTERGPNDWIEDKLLYQY